MYCIGVDIGGTKCAVTLGEYNNDIISILDKTIFPTPSTPTEALEHFLCDIDEVLSKHSLVYKDIHAIGISCGGPLDSKNGVILSPPNLPGWDNIQVVKFFFEKTGIKTLLENDANACAVAEWKFGAGRGFSNVVFLTFGTGMGAGLILDGRLYSGTNGNAGEIGHVRLENHGPSGFGKIGSFEGFCSGGGIAQLGRTMAIEALQRGITPLYCTSLDMLETVSAKTIATAANNGDSTAISVYKLSGEKLGYALSLLVDILNPEVIIIGSIYTRSENLLAEACQRVMKEQCLKDSFDVCKVVPSYLKENIGDYAALSLAML